MLIISQTATFLQIFSEIMLYSKVMFKSMKLADDTFQSNSEYEWVNGVLMYFPPPFIVFPLGRLFLIID